MKKTALNVPNTLSIIRVLLVPAFVAALLLMRDIEIWGLIVPAVIFVITSLTDMLDGKIARKYNLVTDFGKFIDPLADKFMVIGSQIAIMAYLLMTEESFVPGIVFMCVVLLILLRELGVTSLRLVVAGNSGIVVAASMLGKIKTVSQMVGTLVIILEPLVFDGRIASYIAMGIMAFTTVFSGLDYLKAYLPHIDTNK
ncbi:MAG: CDP-diacylglycerol--glycerol-3-phosphate 3-phosphatidyltransferase [Clostridia bacterium]|nr:CDP-diacylglycerol--glycerol-3-phosphate 3-phosphatidyltransferase [Clostridia bacterium]